MLDSIGVPWPEFRLFFASMSQIADPGPAGGSLRQNGLLRGKVIDPIEVIPKQRLAGKFQDKAECRKPAAAVVGRF